MTIGDVKGHLVGLSSVHLPSHSHFKKPRSEELNVRGILARGNRYGAHVP